MRSKKCFTWILNSFFFCLQVAPSCMLMIAKQAENNLIAVCDDKLAMHFKLGLHSQSANLLRFVNGKVCCRNAMSCSYWVFVLVYVRQAAFEVIQL